MSRHLLRVFCGIVVLFLFAAVDGACRAAVAGEEPLGLLVFDRPPYYMLHDGRPAGGFLLDIALGVFAQAGIPVTVQEMPPGRILATFESREIKACAVGWLRTPEREAYARFSLPLYENKALGVVVASETAHELGPAPSLDRLLAAGLTWGMRRGFSYGEVFDAAFKKYPGQNTRLFSDSRLMVRLIAKHRLDAALVCPEELSAQLVAEPELGAAIRFLPIAEAPPGFARHIMCNASVPPALMDRINAAIRAFRGTDRYQALIRVQTGHE